MKIAVVTTLNKKLYEYYAHRFYSTYNWPFDCYIYHEGWIPEIDPMRPIIHRDIYETNPELKSFIQRNSNRNITSLDPNDPSRIVDNNKGYRLDAIRFSFKVFAKTHLMLNCDYDYVFWIDADVIFQKTITEKEIIDKILPSNYCISFLDRPTYYSECGFVGYNLTKPATKKFIHKLREHYTKDLLFQEKEWHDSYVWDQVRKKWLFDEPQFNLAPVTDLKVGNPWVNTKLKDYVHHLKGKKRKDAGRMYV